MLPEQPYRLCIRHPVAEPQPKEPHEGKPVLVVGFVKGDCLGKYQAGAAFRPCLVIRLISIARLTKAMRQKTDPIPDFTGAQFDRLEQTRNWFTWTSLYPLISDGKGEQLREDIGSRNRVVARTSIRFAIALLAGPVVHAPKSKPGPSGCETILRRRRWRGTTSALQMGALFDKSAGLGSMVTTADVYPAS